MTIRYHFPTPDAGWIFAQTMVSQGHTVTDYGIDQTRMDIGGVNPYYIEVRF